jgi:archaeosine synthase
LSPPSEREAKTTAGQAVDSFYNSLCNAFTVRFEVQCRDGLARTGIMEIDGAVHRTPALALADTWNHPAPMAGLKLRQSSLAKEGDIRVAPSGFSSSDRDEGCHVEPWYRGSPFSERQPEGCFAVLDDVAQKMLDSRAFARAVDDIKSGRGLTIPAYCSSVALVHRLAFLAYCGFDVFDSVGIVMASEGGLYLTSAGAFPADEIDEPPCSCQHCGNGVPAENGLLAHNLTSAEDELRLVRHYISRGRLRELVESRVRAEPWQIQCLRLLDLDHHRVQEMHAPIKGSPFVAGSKESLHRPDVTRWRSRLMERYSRPASASILLLLPCSARKPYSLSASHRRFRDAVVSSGAAGIVHEVIVTSPLGLVPRELELFYPAKDYDIPVTGHWDADERRMVEEMVHWLVETQGYDAVVSHLGDESALVNDSLDDHTDTSGGAPGSGKSLRLLETTLRELGTDETGRISKRGRERENLNAIARFQFGHEGECLLDGAQADGRWPNIRIIKDGTQLGMFTGNRGMVSLTMAGGELLSSKDAYWVEIDDFAVRGNLFAVGVEDASDTIRIGDDVVVRHGSDARAVGVARMSSAEMKLADRGEAVHIRHSAR